MIFLIFSTSSFFSLSLFNNYPIFNRKRLIAPFTLNKEVFTKRKKPLSFGQLIISIIFEFITIFQNLLLRRFWPTLKPLKGRKSPDVLFIKIFHIPDCKTVRRQPFVDTDYFVWCQFFRRFRLRGFNCHEC